MLDCPLLSLSSKIASSLPGEPVSCEDVMLSLRREKLPNGDDCEFGEPDRPSDVETDIRRGFCRFCCMAVPIADGNAGVPLFVFVVLEDLGWKRSAIEERLLLGAGGPGVCGGELFVVILDKPDRSSRTEAIQVEGSRCVMLKATSEDVRSQKGSKRILLTGSDESSA